MKAVYIEAHGDVEVLQYGERPDPSPGPSDVVVRVGASALNRLDIFTREGQRGLERGVPTAADTRRRHRRGSGRSRRERLQP